MRNRVEKIEYQWSKEYLQREIKKEKEKKKIIKITIVLVLLMVLLLAAATVKENIQLIIENAKTINSYESTKMTEIKENANNVENNKTNNMQQTGNNQEINNSNSLVTEITEENTEQKKIEEQSNSTGNKTENTTKGYDYSKPVPKSQKVGIEYFSDAVFIGDSRTEGLAINNSLYSKTTVYTEKGLKVDTIFTDKVINKDGKKVTIMEALEKTKFSKVYIMLGINETGWKYNNLFIQKYTEIIDQIKKINPEAVIYIQSILPVSNKVSTEHQYLKNSKINEYNSLIQKMANEENVYYIDVNTAIRDSSGNLPEEAATDGIHLNKTYCGKWLEYLETHTIQ